MVAVQTAEHQSKLSLVRLDGNPTAVNEDGDGLEPVKSSLLCNIALPSGHELLDCLWEPLAAGTTLS